MASVKAFVSASVRRCKTGTTVVRALRPHHQARMSWNRMVCRSRIRTAAPAAPRRGFHCHFPAARAVELLDKEQVLQLAKAQGKLSGATAEQRYAENRRRGLDQQAEEVVESYAGREAAGRVKKTISRAPHPDDYKTQDGGDVNNMSAGDFLHMYDDDPIRSRTTGGNIGEVLTEQEQAHVEARVEHAESMLDAWRREQRERAEKAHKDGQEPPPEVF